MTITLTLLAVAVIGLLIYALASNPKVAEIGRLLFACAVLALLLGAAPAHVGLRGR
jgi:hypothetical protein